MREGPLLPKDVSPRGAGADKNEASMGLNGLCMPLLVANGNRVIRGEVATPVLMRGHYVICPPSWVRNSSLEMKQRERCIVREQIGRKDCENSRKAMQLYLNSLSLSNPEEMGRCRAA